MQYMFSYPQASGTDIDMLDAGSVADVAKAAEEAGWDGLAFTDHPAPGAKWLNHGGHQTLDPFVALGHAAAVTTRLRLLTHLAVAPYRNPLVLAKSAATVDKLSGGRFILGLGTGYHKTEFHALGVDFKERNTLFDETLDVLPLHWQGDAFSYKGLHFDAREVIGRPRPVQNPIPIWIGGNSEISLRRVAQRAQGWMPLVGPREMSAVVRTPVIESMEEIRSKILHLRGMAGERRDQLDIVVPYPDRSIAEPGADAGRHREALDRLEESGVTWVFIPGLSQHPNAERVSEYLQFIGDTYIRY